MLMFELITATALFRCVKCAVTVLHACKTIKQLKEVDKSFRAEIEEIQTALKKV